MEDYTYLAIYRQLDALLPHDMISYPFCLWNRVAEIVHEFNERSKTHKCVLVYGSSKVISILKDDTIKLKDYLAKIANEQIHEDTH